VKRWNVVIRQFGMGNAAG